MPQPRLEDKLAALAALDLSADAAIPVLRHALADKSNLLAGKAARLIGRGRLCSLATDLETAFRRFLVNSTTDKGCQAKLPIAQCLYELGIGSEETFLAGIRHVQLEPAFGEPIDTAAELRGVCAMGLVRIGYADILTELADLLMDAQRPTRVLAARAAAYTGSELAAPLLRMRILAGDADPEVLAECFIALLGLTPAKGLRLVASYLDHANEDLAAEAALAIAGARSPEAAECLLTHWDHHLDPATRQRLLLPLAMLRHPQALEKLLRVITDAPTAMACAAIEAMALYRNDETMRPRILAAAEGRDRAVTEAVRRVFT